MFKLNTLQRTKSGELLMPVVIDGDIISCFNAKKETVYRKLSDFDFSAEKPEKPVITVIAKEEKNTDQLFEKDETVDAEVLPIENNTQDITTDPVVNPTPTDPAPTDTSTTDPTTTDTTDPNGSIWDTVNNGDYI